MKLMNSKLSFFLSNPSSCEMAELRSKETPLSHHTHRPLPLPSLSPVSLRGLHHGGRGGQDQGCFSWCSRSLLRGVLFRQTHEPSRQPFEGLAREGVVWDVGIPSPRAQTDVSLSCGPYPIRVSCVWRGFTADRLELSSDVTERTWMDDPLIPHLFFVYGV